MQIPLGPQPHQNSWGFTIGVDLKYDMFCQDSGFRKFLKYRGGAQSSARICTGITGRARAPMHPLGYEAVVRLVELNCTYVTLVYSTYI